MSTSQKITDLTAITTVAAADLITAVDVSDTTMAATGTNKKITADNLMNSIIPQSSTNMMSKGTVYRFDGVDDKIIIPHSADLEIRTGDWAMSFKLKTPSSALAAQKILFAKGANSATGGWNVLYNTDGTITFTAEDDAGTAVYTLTSTALGYATEYDVTITLDRDGSQYIYLNGVADATTAITNSDDLYDSSNRDLGVHANWSGSVSAGLDGCLSELMIMNFAPTAAEVLDLVSGNIPFKWQYGSQTSKTVNGDMELNSDWTNFGSPTSNAQSAEQAHSGSNSWKVVTDAAVEGIKSSAGVALVEGKEYKLSTWIYHAEGADVIFQVGNQDAGVGFAVTDVTVPTATWTEFTTTFTALTTASAQYWVRTKSGEAAVVTFYVDDYEITPLGAVALFDNTSISAATWYDKANGNDGTVTGASVLNPSAVATDSDNIPIFSVTSGITADTGSAQGNGVLTSSINQIATCANAGDAVTLPSAKPGKVLWVANDGANASDVFPASGDNIDEAGANTALSVAVNAEVQFICTSSGHWSTITSA
jgi:hypothetical protein